MTHDAPDLDAAYALLTPDDSRRLYAAWADDYDVTFARAQDYVLPLRVAEAFHAAGGSGPVLDVGAGTGLCAMALAGLGTGPIDGTDISAEMLRAAARKDIYRDTIEADLTVGLPVAADSYGGIVSSGTFTNGHVGSGALDEVLRVARRGAWVVVSINTAHFAAAGFAAKLAAMSGAIEDLALPEVRIYGPAADGPHKDDTALIARFRKV